VDTVICRLPGGYVDGRGEVHREVELAPLSGREEELLATRPGPGGGARLVTAVLARCVRRLGPTAPVGEVFIRELLVGDRLFLLLKLRELTFGDRVQATVTCPWTGCHRKVDLEFSLRDVAVGEAPERSGLYRTVLSPEAATGSRKAAALPAAAAAAATGDREVTFRLPDGGDQEALAALVEENEAAALTGLLARCVTSVGSCERPGPEEIAALSPLARREIERAMLERSPRADLALDMTCAECGRPFTAPFDIEDCFFGELTISRERLGQEVHYLAYHYHWSEREIMDMPRDRRRRYIDVLAGEIERLNDAAR
jgi:hypothetical protein